MLEDIFAIVTGMYTTLKHIIRPPVTVQYPDVKRPTRSRFKGRHELKRYDNGFGKVHGLFPLCSRLSRRCHLCGSG